MGTTLSFLPSLFGVDTTWGSGGSLLNTLYGIAGRGSNVFGQNPVTALRAAEQNATQQVKATAAKPEVARAVNAFRSAVAKATSVSQLLTNPAVLPVLLTANGLGDQVGYTALARRTLMSDATDPKSLASTLSDTRWKPVVQTYDFANKGLKIIQQPKVIDTIANAYAEITWRKSLDATTPGLSNALTFRANAAAITSVDQILGDPVLRDVVTTALGIPIQIAFQELTAQEKAISTRLDLTQFKKPSYVESFVQRYLIAKGNAASTANATPSIAALAIADQGLIV